MNAIAPLALTVSPESTVICDPSISRVPPRLSRLPLISTLDLPALMIREVIADRAVVSAPEPSADENWMPLPLSLTFRVSRPVGSLRLMTAVVPSVKHRVLARSTQVVPSVNRLKWVTVAMICLFAQSRVVGSRTQVPFATS